MDSPEPPPRLPGHKTAFLALVLAQTAHSLEEYYGRLWEVFPPATFLTGLVSEDREFGFIVINAGLVLFGLWCAAWPVRMQWPVAKGFIGFWIVIELINGVGHPLWSIARGGYTPGVVTAVPLFFVALYLCWTLVRTPQPVRNPARAGSGVWPNPN